MLGGYFPVLHTQHTTRVPDITGEWKNHPLTKFGPISSWHSLRTYSLLCSSRDSTEHARPKERPFESFQDVLSPDLPSHPENSQLRKAARRMAYAMSPPFALSSYALPKASLNSRFFRVSSVRSIWVSRSPFADRV